MLKTRIATAASAFALVVAGQAALATAANAALPSCLAPSVKQSGVKTIVVVFNGCSTTQKFKIAWDLAWDSGCYTLGVGKHITDSETYSGFEGLKSC